MMYYTRALLLSFIYSASFWFSSVNAAFDKNSGGSNNWYGRGCPPHATGQFPYEEDCRKFYNCFKGRGQLSICAPGTLFNPAILECDFPQKVTCMKSGQKSSYTSRLTDDTSTDQHSHHYHHQHFQHTAAYHGEGQYSQGIAHQPHYDQHSHHYRNWHNVQSQNGPSIPHPHQKGHYIYSTKTIPRVSKVSVGPYHSGVQPPGILPSVPSGQMLPPLPSEPHYIQPSQPSETHYIQPPQPSEPHYIQPPQPSGPHYVQPAEPHYVQPPLPSGPHYVQPPQPAEPHYVQPPQPSGPHYVQPPQPSGPHYVQPQPPVLSQYPHPALSQPSNSFNPPPNSKPTIPQQVFHSDTQGGQQKSDFDKKFQTVVPQPAIIYNSYGNPIGIPANTIKFPENRASFSRNPQYPQQVPTNYNENNYGSYGINQGQQTSFTEPIPKVYDNQNSRDGYDQSSSFNTQYPGHRVDTNSRTTDQVHTDGNPTASNTNFKNVCPKDFQGLMPHSDCTKFLSCANGRTFVMDCGPGTRFHPDLHNCVHAHEVKCGTSDDTNSQDLETQGTHNRDSSIFIHSTKETATEVSTTIEPIQEQVTVDVISSQEQVDFPVEEDSVDELSYEHIKKPTVSVRTTISLSKEQSNLKPEHVFRPENITSASRSANLPQGRFISKRNSTIDRQILRLRGSPSQFEGFVEMQLSPGSWGMLCDKPSKWRSEEAHVICKTLGYPRGAELTWQGLPPELSNMTSGILAADEVVCTGVEESILECNLSVGSGCQPGQNGIWVRCYGHGQSRCHPNEMSLGEKCYSLIIPDEEAPTEHLVGFTQGEALSHCQKNGGYLLDITSQLENDFVSEWLLRQNVDGHIMTSGVGMPLMGGTIWIWEGSESTFMYHNWWPGWTGVKSIPPQSNSKAQCIVLKRHFPCQESNEGEEKLCDAQYYFWDLEDCTTMSTSLPYVCERPADKIGCVMGTGTSYKGGANVTRNGKTCLDWEIKEVLSELKYKVSESDRKMSLTGHNFCRNIAGKETHPWCFVKEGNIIKKELCDIPPCSQAMEKSARYFQCPSDHFSCGSNGECIPSDKVCDGKFDCSNSIDEVGCTKPKKEETLVEHTILSEFKIYEHMKIVVMEIELFVSTPLTECAKKCLERVSCRSFSYFPLQEQCLLSESNIGLSGSLIPSDDWNYYELKSKSLNCQNSHVCDNGKCIANETVCNGRNDCGDNSDEKDCSWLKKKIQIRLTGGSKAHEGAIEVKTQDRWGLVCDDEFDMKDGDVVCRHLGFPLGALEIKKHSYFKPNHTATFLIDNLNCKGNETSLADCHHNGWGVHDCREEEYNSIDFMKCSNKAAGIICKVAKTDCKFNYWQCEGSAECIPLGFLCDNVKDCADSSDEDPVKCNAPVEVRLVGIGGDSRSNKVTEGRVEVRRFGVWGTVCDDDFGTKEAEVVCNSLGFKGTAQAYKEAAYGAGQGVIWLDQVHCIGNETSITECMSDAWGQTNCRHNEDVAVVCSPQMLNVPSKEISKKEEVVNQNIDLDIDDIFNADCGTLMEDFDIVSSGFAPKVVSGFETVKGTYPWQATIRIKSVSGKSSHWCGAVVVSRFHVITAGHCLRDYIKAAYFIRAGDYDSEVDEGTEQDLEIDEMWIHSDLDKGVKLNNDVAIVKVKNPGFQFNTWVHPACLPKTKVSTIPSNCTISGWGSNANPGMGFARILHATWLQPLPSHKCRAPNIYGDSLSNGMFCAGSLDGGPDSCQGDSGGPFLCPVEGHLTLFGITSWGHGCGRSNRPGVYTNVPYYLDWIHDKIKYSMINHKYT